MPRNTCELHVGRVLEIRLARGYETVADVEEMVSMIGERVATLPSHVKHVTVADWRTCRVLSTPAAQRAVEMMRHTNPRTECSAILHTNESPTAVMQYLRLVREAANPNRRVFTDPQELLAWVTPRLTPLEVARVSWFLGSSGSVPALAPAKRSP